jgi:hypothetical protein
MTQRSEGPGRSSLCVLRRRARSCFPRESSMGIQLPKLLVIHIEGFHWVQYSFDKGGRFTQLFRRNAMASITILSELVQFHYFSASVEPVEFS